jgi:hypothetical protein
VQRSPNETGNGWQIVVAQGVYMGNSLAQAGLLTQPWPILLRYTGTVHALCR